MQKDTIFYAILLSLVVLFLPSIWFRFGKYKKGRYRKPDKPLQNLHFMEKPFPSVEEYKMFLSNFSKNSSYFTSLYQIGKVSSDDAKAEDENSSFPVYNLVISSGFPKPIVVFIGGLLQNDLMSPLVLLQVFGEWITEHEETEKFLTLFDYHVIPMALPKHYNDSYTSLNFITEATTKRRRTRKPSRTTTVQTTTSTTTVLTTTNVVTIFENANITNIAHIDTIPDDKRRNFTFYQENLSFKKDDKVYFEIFARGDETRDERKMKFSLCLLKKRQKPIDTEGYEALEQFHKKFHTNYGLELFFIGDNEKYLMLHIKHYKGSQPATTFSISKNSHVKVTFEMLESCKIAISVYHEDANMTATVPICFADLHCIFLDNALPLALRIDRKRIRLRRSNRDDLKFDYWDNVYSRSDRKYYPLFNFDVNFWFNSGGKSWGGDMPFSMEETLILRNYLMCVRSRTVAVFLLFSPIGSKSETEAITYPYASMSTAPVKETSMEFLANIAYQKLRHEMPHEHLLLSQSSKYTNKLQYGRLDDWIYTGFQIPVINLQFYYDHGISFEDTLSRLAVVKRKTKLVIDTIVNEMFWNKMLPIRRARYNKNHFYPWPLV